MTTTINKLEMQSMPPLLNAAVQAACSTIAPSWPLDQAIAVNPWWGLVKQPLRTASARLKHLCGTSTTMPEVWYREQLAQGHISKAALGEALRRHARAESVDAFLSASEAHQPSTRLTLLTDLLDERRDTHWLKSISDIVVHAVSQHCASWFDRSQASWQPRHAGSLYGTWRAIATHDSGPSMLSGIPGIATRISQLPDDHELLIAQAREALGIGLDECEDYFAALLLSVNGWASWCAYLRWQAQLDGKPDGDAELRQLLAIRLAWEWVLAECAGSIELLRDWRELRRRQACTVDNSNAWIWQEALEISFQESVHAGLQRTPQAREAKLDHRTEAARPVLDAVFCIDVRSEPLRRALEACAPGIRTHGFAGFFGLPIEYQPLGSSAARPQLPGLLKPALRVTQTATTSATTERLQRVRTQRLDARQQWKAFRTSPASAFGFVETLGLAYAWKLFKSSTRGNTATDPATAALRQSEAAQLRPSLDALPLSQRVALASGALKGMSMTSDLAPCVLLIGHGSVSTNNAHASTLDCGACCGQSGEVNARLLADLLNDTAVRAGLREAGCHVPDDTRFIAALHNTTTDAITLLGVDATAPGNEALQQTTQWLSQASSTARTIRSTSLGITATSKHDIEQALVARARDWAQVRPEFGLAGNAAFIAAPRARTQHMNLGGRSFLHDYDATQDKSGAILELILTAPMVVAHWINLQYYASTVDNRKWGSGNKVLHNVVGGTLGVFEGNGGDLRIGLSQQSLHDGEHWVHAPLRLSVWVEASRDAISAVIERNPAVAQLISGEWLYLFNIEPAGMAIHQCRVDATGQVNWTEVRPH